MAVCASCKVRHAPYTCAQYQELRQAENAADDRRAGARRGAAAELEQTKAGRRRRRWCRLLRRSTRPI